MKISTMNCSRVLTLLSLSVALALTACSGGGRYYKDDGPPSVSASKYANAPDAVPRYEKPHSGANKPYRINGKRYTPITGDKPMKETGIGSWYGKKFHGRQTSIGEIYNMYEMTAAHKTMELPSYAKVTNLENGRSVIVRVNDRGPFVDNRIIDLSYAAASKLGYVNKGTAKVRVERIRMADIKAGRVPEAAGTVIKQFDIDKITDNSADIAAIASVIGTAASVAKAVHDRRQDEQSNVKASNPPTTTTSTAAVTLDPSPTTSNVITEVVDLSGAVNLTEAAKEGMVSTEVDLTTSPVISDLTWSIQAGAFSSQTNADNYAKELRATLTDSVSVVRDGNLYRVIIGDFSTKEEASHRAETIGSVLGKKLVPIQKP